MKRIHKGFTLIEMVIVLFIISLLLLIMIPNLVAQKNNAKNKTDDALRTTIVTQAQMYSENENIDPVNLGMLKDASYITDKQYKQAQKVGFKDKDNLLSVNVADVKPKDQTKND